MWKRADKEINNENIMNTKDLLRVKRDFNNAIKNDSILRKAMSKDKYSGKDLDVFSSPEQLHRSLHQVQKHPPPAYHN